jgi:hypothetical protein
VVLRTSQIPSRKKLGGHTKKVNNLRVVQPPCSVAKSSVNRFNLTLLYRSRGALLQGSTKTFTQTTNRASSIFSIFSSIRPYNHHGDPKKRLQQPYKWGGKGKRVQACQRREEQHRSSCPCVCFPFSIIL